LRIQLGYVNKEIPLQKQKHNCYISKIILDLLKINISKEATNEA